MAVKTSPLTANRGMKYVRMKAVGILAVLLGTWELLLSTVGKAKKANPALPIEIRRSTRVNQNCSNSSLVNPLYIFPTVRPRFFWVTSQLNPQFMGRSSS
jgi:hypothetical protein